MAKGSALRKPANDTSSDEFAALLDESLGGSTSFEGSVVKGTVIRIANDFVTIDVGLKSEGRVALREFANGTGAPEIKEGDVIDIFVDRMENKEGEAVLSRDKARREEAWTVLEKAFTDNERVMGTIFGRVKGGFTVDLSGAVAFLPGSQVDVRPVRDVGPLMGQAQQFQILKMDRRRGNIVVSRRAVMEETRAEDRTRLMGALSEGQVLDGVVKNITDYGAFVDLGGVDGLLHVTDIAWKRINHPSEALTIGQQVKVQVVRFNPETQRISLGMKQLMSDPWDGAGAKYPVGLKLKGRVTNITDYGAFVDLGGVDGLLHVTDIAWKRINHPSEALTIGQQVKVQVIRFNAETQRISLGMKQLMSDPWDGAGAKYPVAFKLKGRVTNITDYGAFVELEPGVEGLVHVSEMSWTKKNVHPGKIVSTSQEVEVMVLDVDMSKRRISLGLKQCMANPWESFAEKYPAGTELEG
ncbi:MAG: 30S ribosomal protein S1, partial [Reyranella sp.]|nr:30S ribosomal protein S1 [Reyranella sp.]